jgi:hypothetical protein
MNTALSSSKLNTHSRITQLIGTAFYCLLLVACVSQDKASEVTPIHPSITPQAPMTPFATLTPIPFTPTTLPTNPTPTQPPTPSPSPIPTTFKEATPVARSTLVRPVHPLNQTEIWYISSLSEINALNPTTLQQRTIIRPTSEDKLIIDDASFSPNGQYIAYSGHLTAGNPDSVWVARADGSNRQKVIESEKINTFLWLEKNQLIIIKGVELAKRIYQGEWFLYDLDKQQLQPLKFLGDKRIVCEQPRSSPQLGYLTIANENEYAIGLGHLEVQNDSLTPIVDIPLNPQSAGLYGIDSCLRWSVNRQEIFFTDKGKGLNLEWYRVTNNGQLFKRIADFGKDYEWAYPSSLWSVSPDGQWIATDLFLNGPRSAELVAGIWLPAIISTDGKVVKIFERQFHQGYYTWSPDSRYVAAYFFKDGVGSTIQMIDTQTLIMSELIKVGGGAKVFDWR